MKKLLRNSSLAAIVLVVMSTSLSLPVEAFSFSLNPVTFLQKTTEIIVNRVSDIIYFLIMQKKYIFNSFVDPNVYFSLNIPVTLKPILSRTTTSTTEESFSSKLLAVTTSTAPSVKKTLPVSTIITQNQPTSSLPAPIVKPSSVSSPIIEPTLDRSDNSKVLNLINKERTAVSLKPLSANSVLDMIASLRADDLFENQYFEHTSPDGKSVSDLAQKMDYSYLLIGENLALGSFDGNQGIVLAWMESSGHKANILNGKYTESGVSVKTGVFNGGNATIAVQIFGLPMTNCSKPRLETKTLIDTSSVSIKQMQDQALEMYDSLTALKNNPGVDQSYYNQKIQEYNYFARKVNDAIIALKEIIDIYNIEVGEYNSCINLSI